MTNRQVMFSVAVMAFLLAAFTPAFAAVPEDTAAFVSHCTDHFDECRSEVVDINNINMMQQIGGNHACSLPATGAGDRKARHEYYIVATNAILDWLKANSASRAPKTFDAISQAMKALWPSECR